MFKRVLHFLRRWSTYFFETPSEAHMGDVALSTTMENAIGTWAAMYCNSGINAKNSVPSLGLPSAISAEIARLATLETQIKFTGARANFMHSAMGGAISGLRRYAEYACALGGGVFKPYVKNNTVCIDYIQADNFIPTEFDAHGNMTGAVFCDQIARGNSVYTRLERHTMHTGEYKIENKAFYSANGTDLGKPISLQNVPEWSTLASEVKLSGVTKPLFAYLRVPGANHIDRHSPLGVSVFSRASALIAHANEQYGRLLWEFEGGELAVDAAQDVLMGLSDDTPRMPKNKERLFRRLASDDADFYKVFAPTLRDESLKNGLDIILKRIEFNCSLAYGTLSDPQSTDKTAEEIRASKQRSYAAVHDLQNALQKCMDELAAAVSTYADIYSLAPSGTYHIAYKWDDSILNDEAAQREQMRQDCKDGAAQWWEYRVRFYGEDEATAKKHLAAACRVAQANSAGEDGETKKGASLTGQ